MKILVVDDDVAINQLFRYYLKSEFKGEIIAAYNGADAVDKCLNHQPDLVFMDIMMPEKDGLTTIRELRASGFANPIIVITSFHEANENLCYTSGATEIMRKPVNRHQVLNQLRWIRNYA